MGKKYNWSYNKKNKSLCKTSYLTRKLLFYLWVQIIVLLIPLIIQLTPSNLHTPGRYNLVQRRINKHNLSHLHTPGKYNLVQIRINKHNLKNLHTPGWYNLVQSGINTPNLTNLYTPGWINLVPSRINKHNLTKLHTPLDNCALSKTELLNWSMPSLFFEVVYSLMLWLIS